jgi:hypothetical protein
VKPTPRNSVQVEAEAAVLPASQLPDSAKQPSVSDKPTAVDTYADVAGGKAWHYEGTLSYTG